MVMVEMKPAVQIFPRLTMYIFFSLSTGYRDSCAAAGEG